MDWSSIGNGGDEALRMLGDEAAHNMTNTRSTGGCSTGEPVVVWVVTGIILLFVSLFISFSVAWCCCYERCRVAVGVYQESLRQRRLRKQEAALKTSEQRTRKLLQSFKRRKVTMVVGPGDILEENAEAGEVSLPSSGRSFGGAHKATKADRPNGTLHVENGTDDVAKKEEAAWTRNECHNGDDLELGHGMGFLLLHTNADRKERRKVPNCCAVCLCAYNTGESVVWSSNPKCLHAFHQECVMEWLVKRQDSTSCPCCRQEFTDLDRPCREKRIRWEAGRAFELSVISIR